MVCGPGRFSNLNSSNSFWFNFIINLGLLVSIALKVNSISKFLWGSFSNFKPMPLTKTFSSTVSAYSTYVFILLLFISSPKV